MIHKMKLQPSPFYSISSGKKTIEMRLNDEKRKLIKIGDTIEFTHMENGETVRTCVVNLTSFPSFKELYEHFDKTALGYEKNEIAHHTDMSKYYDEREISLYGVLAIEIKLI